MTNTNDIDIYLSEIAERLWSGHASLMVGAGFSKNADKKSPSWNDLGNSFYEKLYGKVPTEKDDGFYMDVLKLAETVEAYFERKTLDDILHSNIPDKEIVPSEIHEILVQLPWTDIFTTNYDTLLERAAEKTTQKENNYSVITNKEDLALSKSPRIVKLHGSFPSQRPFVITQEDYRKYPKENAPFVNIVRQSLMENNLCLIGFSGNDPNFLQWIGWVRDNLEKYAPKIYFIGLSIPYAEKKWLETKNIIPVDISCLCKTKERESDVIPNTNPVIPPERDDYYESLLEFVKFLQQMGKEKQEEKNNTSEIETNLDFPNEKIFFHFDRDKEIKPQFEEITQAWKTTRLSYPNWLILPKDNRELFRHYTENHFIYNIEKIDAPLDIEFLYEFNWRIEKCLFPIFNDWIKYYESIIAKYNPFPKNIQIENANITPETNKNLEWKAITNYWIELQFSLLRHYREESINEKWLSLAEKMDKIKDKLSPDLLARYCYERSLYYLFLLDITSVRKELANWTSDTSLLYWEAKRAGLIAELGDVEDAEKILEISLNEIRSRLKLSPVKNDYALVSQEAYILQLSRYVRNSVNFTKGNYGKDKTEKYSERWNELIKYKCDPWGELKSFESILKAEPQYTKAIEKKYNFGIGSVTNTHHLSKGSTYAMESYAFLRYIEEIGIPFKLPNITFGTNTAKKAIACISNYSSNWGFVSFIRTGDSKMIEDIFNRRALSFLNQQKCDELANNYLEVLMKSASEIVRGNTYRNANFAISLSTIIPEILSRLCVKCSYDIKLKILNFLKELYLSNAVNQSKYKGINVLVQYLMQSFSLPEQYELLSELLEFPIIDDTDRRNPYPDIFAFIELEKSKLPNKIKIDTNKIDELISFLSEDNPNRKIAISRLIVLWNCGLLNKTQQNKFAKVLWKSVDKNGFPIDTNYYYFAFIKFPHPNDVNPAELLRSYIKNTKLPIEGKKEKGSGIGMSKGDYPLFHNILGTSNDKIDFQWNKEDINELVANIIEWWNSDKEYLKQTGERFMGSISDEFKARFKNMVWIFSNVMVSNIELLDSKLYPQIEKLLSELSDYGMPDLEAKVSFLKLFPNKKQEIYDKIKLQLYSKNEEAILDAVNAVSVLVIFGNEDVFDLVKNIAENIKSRTEIALDRFLESMTVIMKYNQKLITESILSDLQLGFEFLYNEILIYDTEEIVHKKLLIQRSASHLLVLLKKYYLERNKIIPQYISKWESICLDENEFAEIRNIWLNNKKE
jgi:hypothetical protein